MLVQKPQFDTAVLKVGRAIRVEDISFTQTDRKLPYSSKFKSLKTDAIITEVAPLTLTVCYFDTTDNHTATMVIPVDVVADNLVEIKLMEVVKNDDK